MLSGYGVKGKGRNMWRKLTKVREGGNEGGEIERKIERGGVGREIEGLFTRCVVVCVFSNQ